jgi:hypothetical protein
MKNARSWLFALITLSSVSFASASVAQVTDDERRATTTAEAWLLVMDVGRFGEAWEGASTGFRAAVSRDAWVKQAAAVRSPLGNVKSRKVVSVSSQKNPPGAPSGDYVIVVFETDFAESSPTRRETVSVYREVDGSWRVTGYFVR